MADPGPIADRPVSGRTQRIAALRARHNRHQDQLADEARLIRFHASPTGVALGKSPFGNINDSSIDRTRRLFYVTCSRTEERLAIVYYSDNPGLARTALLDRGWFADDKVEVITA